MRKSTVLFIGVLCAAYIAVAPGMVWAATDVSVTPPVLITEIQAADPSAASHEFIELYNPTDTPLDLSTWQLWYMSGAATDLTAPLRRIFFVATNGSPQIIAPHSYYVLTGNETYLQGQAQLAYTATLAETGHLRLMRQTADFASTCMVEDVDSISWGTATPAVAALSPGTSAERATIDTGQYVHARTNATDFMIATAPTPGKPNSSTLAAAPPVSTAPPLAVRDTACTLPAPPPPAAPDNTLVPPTTSPPAVSKPVEAESEGAGEPPHAGPVLPARDVGLIAPQLSELLPNPASPQRDTTDEFIELYNANSVPFDLSGFMLEVGSSKKRRYTFPAGTMLEGKSFTAFLSATTKLTLANTTGQVWLLDPFGSVIAQADPYTTAKDGQAWVLANGVWAWTVSATPGKTNVLQAPTQKATKKSSATPVKKEATSSTVKGAATNSKAPADTAKEPETLATSVSASSPLHPAVLALAGCFAVLYGAYEYRNDVANKFRQFRANRAARAEARRQATGR